MRALVYAIFHTKLGARRAAEAEPFRDDCPSRFRGSHVVYPVPMAPMTGALCYHQDRSSMVEFALRERELARVGESLTNETSCQLSG